MFSCTDSCYTKTKNTDANTTSRYSSYYLDEFYSIPLSNFAGYVEISNNTIYNEFLSSRDIKKDWSISLDVSEYNIDKNNKSLIDSFIYNNISFDFEIRRSDNIKIYVKIDKFIFDAYFTETDNSNINENSLLNEKNLNTSKIYQHCDSPIPSKFDFSIESQWIDSGISPNYAYKVPGINCHDSNRPFWDNKYENICDSPTGYLNTFTDTFVKVFECDSSLEQFKYYYTSDQLYYYSNLADNVKIQVVDYDSFNTTYSVESKTNAYAATNLRNNRAISHPYNWNDTGNYFVFNVSQYWTGDEELLNAMEMSSLQDFNQTKEYDFMDGVYINEYNTFYVANSSEFGQICRAFNDDENVTISVYWDIGLTTISTGLFFFSLNFSFFFHPKTTKRCKNYKN